MNFILPGDVNLKMNTLSIRMNFKLNGFIFPPGQKQVSYEFETDFSHTTIPGFESRRAGFVFVRLKKFKSLCILGPGFDFRSPGFHVGPT